MCNYKLNYVDGDSARAYAAGVCRLYTSLHKIWIEFVTLSRTSTMPVRITFPCLIVHRVTSFKSFSVKVVRALRLALLQSQHPLPNLSLEGHTPLPLRLLQAHRLQLQLLHLPLRIHKANRGS